MQIYSLAKTPFIAMIDIELPMERFELIGMCMCRAECTVVHKIQFTV